MNEGNTPTFRCRATTFAVLTLLIGASAGCGGESVPLPPLDPQGAAAKALELYDGDGDGLLNKTELEACPGLLSAIERYDTDGDGQISADELAAKLETLLSSGVGMMSVSCHVTLKGRPISGAQVRYVPEAFLGESVFVAEGTTDETGLATPVISDELLPETQRGIAAMQPGVYRVEITHPESNMPAKFGGEESPLGHDVDPSVRGGTHFQCELSNK